MIGSFVLTVIGELKWSFGVMERWSCEAIGGAVAPN